jgi:hypothetical protein
MRRLFHPDVDAAREAPGPLTAWAIVALLAVLHAAPFLITFVEGDFARDLYAALRIAQGRDLPSRGRSSHGPSTSVRPGTTRSRSR